MLFLSSFILCITTLWSSVEAFSISSLTTTTTPQSSPSQHQFLQPIQRRRWRLNSSAPSDSASSDDENIDEFGRYGYGASSSSTAVDTSAAQYEPTTGEALVNTVLNLIPTNFASGTNNMSPEQRASIQEALYQLESVNPTTKPASSPLLNGVWELRYVGGYTADWALPSPTRQIALFLYSGGYSPGVFAYTLAQQLPSNLIDLTSSSSSDSSDTTTASSSIEVVIARAPQPRVEASVGVKLLGGAIAVGKVSVKARLDVESDMRLRETYESVSVFGQPSTTIPQMLQYGRDLYVTYLDEDLLIVRDGSGVPEVLVRKAKQFQRNWGTEPSAIDDLVPPGDGQDAQF